MSIGVGQRLKNLRILTREILMSFARLVHSNSWRVRRIWIVAPWIGLHERSDALHLLVDSLKGKNCPVLIITRPPDAAWHSRAIRFLQANLKTTIFISPSLHSKLYIIECDGFRAAIVGSPNLTPRADRGNREIGVELRTTMELSSNDVAAAITELIQYAFHLRGEDDTRML